MRQSLCVRWGELRCALAALLPRLAINAKPGEFPASPLAVLALIVAGCLASTLPAGAAQQLQVLKGHVPKAAKRLSAISRLDSTRHLDLAIGLPLRNRENLTNLLQ